MDQLNVATALRRLLKSEPVDLVQIGAFTGRVGNDPLFPVLCEYNAEVGPKKPFRVVLVEPVNRYFRDLVINCAPFSSFVTCENLAIAESLSLREFYVISEEAERSRADIPDWTSQLGSLMPNRITDLWDFHEKERVDGDDISSFLRNNTVCEIVVTISLNDLMRKNRMSSLDVLQIDAEGYDFEILRTIDFSRLRPKLINYEYVLLREARGPAEDLMHRSGI